MKAALKASNDTGADISGNIKRVEDARGNLESFIITGRLRLEMLLLYLKGRCMLPVRE